MAPKTIHPSTQQIAKPRSETSRQLGKLQVQEAYLAAMAVRAPALNLVA